MDKQQFDHIENRIRQAADQISVSFSEEAWKKMEIKLNNEFNKDRRRGIIWWWFSFMLLGIAALGIYVYNYTSSVPSKTLSHSSTTVTGGTSHKKIIRKVNDITIGHTKDPKSVKKETVIGNNNKDKIPVIRNGTSDNTVTSPIGSQVKGMFNQVTIPSNVKSVSSNKSLNVFKEKYTRKSVTPSFNTGKLVNLSHNSENASPVRIRKFNTFEYRHKTNEPSKPGDDNNKEKQQVVGSGNVVVVEHPVLAPSPTNMPDAQVKANEPAIQRDSVVTIGSGVDKKSSQVRLDRSPSKGFYFMVSTSADATGIKSISVKETNPIYGIGIGYRFNNKISMQTGFYFGNKVYQAGPGDYKVKPGSYIARIIRADAECYIYDIPLTLRFDVLRKKMHHVYVTTGLSSYILKRELYDIHFFNLSGSYRHMTYTYKHNINYLAVVNLSIGYEHKISNTLYIQAEPYIKSPLAGLGEGSVKLYSAGLQLGVKYQPLKRKK